MKILEGKTLSDAIASLQKLRSWSPHRFGGTHHLVTPEGIAYFRTTEAAKRACAKYSVTSYTTVKL